MTRATALGVIAARGGSKGLPRKNVLSLGGRPLIAHTIAAALACPALTRTVVSSDDAEILEAARAAGCPARSCVPPRGADRSSGGVALQALDWVSARAARTEGCAAAAPPRWSGGNCGPVATLLDDPESEGVGGGTERPTPYWMLRIAERRLHWLFPEGGATDHRQQLPPAYQPNGSIYAVRTTVLREQRTFYPRATAPYVMPREASVNIDSELDFQVAELLLARRRG